MLKLNTPHNLQHASDGNPSATLGSSLDFAKPGDIDTSISTFKEEQRSMLYLRSSCSTEPFSARASASVTSLSLEPSFLALANARSAQARGNPGDKTVASCAVPTQEK